MSRSGESGEVCAWPVHPVSPEVSLRVTRAMPELDAGLDAAVEAHWQAALAEKRLFNGRIFCVDHLAPERIEGHWTEYRRLIAQLREPGLRAALRIRSLAACGAVRGPDGVAVGRREALATYQPGLWQLPPAGSVDSGAAVPGGADWRWALLNELDEEMGIGSAEVLRTVPLCVVEHPSGVMDLGALVETRLSAGAMAERQAGARDQEYDAFFVAAPGEVPGLVARRGGVLVPPAYAFLGRL